jgi:hypothetical protein
MTKEEKREYHRLYQQKLRQDPEKLAMIREYDRDLKRKKRRTDPEWLERERARRRKYGKVRLNRGDVKGQIQRYRAKPENKIKDQARSKIRDMVFRGVIIRPEHCELCHKQPAPFLDLRAKTQKRYPLRADHYKGYDKENWLVVRWICKDCDGLQLRSKNKLVI